MVRQCFLDYYILIHYEACMSQPNEVLCSDMTLQYICVYMTITVTCINREVVELMEMEIILSFNKHAAVIMHETL